MFRTEQAIAELKQKADKAEEDYRVSHRRTPRSSKAHFRRKRISFALFQCIRFIIFVLLKLVYWNYCTEKAQRRRATPEKAPYWSGAGSSTVFCQKLVARYYGSQLIFLSSRNPSRT